MPLTTVASMPQKLGQIAQPDLTCFTSSAAAPALAAPTVLAGFAACAIASNVTPVVAMPPSAPIPFRKLRRRSSIRHFLPWLVGRNASRSQRIAIVPAAIVRTVDPYQFRQARCCKIKTRPLSLRLHEEPDRRAFLSVQTY